MTHGEVDIVVVAHVHVNIAVMDAYHGRVAVLVGQEGVDHHVHAYQDEVVHKAMIPVEVDQIYTAVILAVVTPVSVDNVHCVVVAPADYYATVPRVVDCYV